MSGERPLTCTNAAAPAASARPSARQSILSGAQFTTGAASYFSINNGATNLDNWNNFRTGNNGDLGDWAPSAGNDAYDDNSFPGVINAVTSVDLTNMAALGWVPTSASQPSSPSSPSSPSAPAGLQFVGVGEFGPNQSGALAWQSQGQIELLPGPCVVFPDTQGLGPPAPRLGFNPIACGLLSSFFK